MAIDIGMIGSMGMQAVGAYSDYSIAKTQSKMEQNTKSYRAEMAAISEALQYNDMSVAEAQLSDQARRATIALEKDEMRDKGAAEVAAAAAGVAGGSVDNTMRSLKRSSLNANAARTKNYESALANANNQRKSIEMQAIFNEDISPISIPSAGTALLGLSKGLIETYDDNQPKGYKTSDSMSRMLDFNWGKK